MKIDAMVNKRTKEKIKDIVFMTWGFIIGGIFFWLLCLQSINYLTGNAIKEIGEIAENNFYPISLLIFILFFGFCYILKKLKW